MAAATIRNARLVTLRGAAGARRGAAMRELGVIERGHLIFEEGVIRALGAGEPKEWVGEVIDAGGAALLPALVDCHTHLCWAGSRFDEWEQKLAGTPYLEILKSGGGIMSTVRAVRATSEAELTSLLAARLRATGRLGTGAIEVKTGYGLSVKDELKMLAAIGAVAGAAAGAAGAAARAGAGVAGRLVVPTFLGAHAKDPDNASYVDQVIEEGLPAAVAAAPGIAADAFCEEGAWSLAETRRYLEKAKFLGMPLRLHADQFHSLGAVPMAIELGARSVDHLEATTPADLTKLAASGTFGVVLPCCGFALDGRYANARSFIDQGGALAIASNANPGSAPSLSLGFSIALAVRFMRLTIAEAITAATWNAACVLGLESSVGSLEVGKRADVILLDSPDERSLALDLGGPGPRRVIFGGRSGAATMSA